MDTIPNAFQYTQSLCFLLFLAKNHLSFFRDIFPASEDGLLEHPFINASGVRSIEIKYVRECLFPFVGSNREM
jgi:hypothetical protein